MPRSLWLGRRPLRRIRKPGAERVEEGGIGARRLREGPPVVCESHRAVRRWHESTLRWPIHRIAHAAHAASRSLRRLLPRARKRRVAPSP